MARGWSRDTPDTTDDLEQEALLEIWLKGETRAPVNHQLRTAQNRMLSVRKLGKSVDGKLDAFYKRARPYVVLSMEWDALRFGEDLLLFEDVLLAPHRVEEAVIAKLTFLNLVSLLEPKERMCTVLLCMGFTRAEVAERVSCTSALVAQLVESTRRKLWPYLKGEEER